MSMATRPVWLGRPSRTSSRCWNCRRNCRIYGVGQLTTGHAKILKGITDPERQMQLSKEIIAHGLSVHATEAFLKQQAAEKQAAAGRRGHGLEETHRRRGQADV